MPPLKFTRRRPCGECPFRTDLGFPFFGKDEVGHARAQNLSASFQGNHGFPCHKTTDWVEDKSGEVVQQSHDRTVACAGMVIMAEKSPEHSNILRIAARLGIHDPSILDMDSPVYPNYQAFIDAHKPEE